MTFIYARYFAGLTINILKDQDGYYSYEVREFGCKLWQADGYTSAEEAEEGACRYINTLDL